MDPLLIIVAVFIVITFYFLINFLFFASRDDSINKRLNTLIDEVKEEKLDIDERKLLSKNKETSTILQNIGKIITPAGINEKISLKLRKADLPLRANEFVSIILLCSSLPTAFIWFFIKNFFLGIIASVFGFFLPLFYINIKISLRKKAFSDQLLDTLIMMSNSLKAGYSFLQAMDLICKESPAPISQEFKQVLRENALGIDIETSLLSLASRMESEDFDLVVTVVIIQRQIGGNLSEILDNISNTIRERIKIKGEIETLTAQAKLSGIVIALMPFALGFMFYLINPEYITYLFTFKHGWYRGYYLVIFGLFIQFIGFMIIRNITNIEV